MPEFGIIKFMIDPESDEIFFIPKGNVVLDGLKVLYSPISAIINKGPGTPGYLRALKFISDHAAQVKGLKAIQDQDLQDIGAQLEGHLPKSKT